MRRALVSVLAATLLLGVRMWWGRRPAVEGRQGADAGTPTPSKSRKAAPMEVDKVKTKAIDDDRFGHTIKVVKVVRNFPFPSTMSGLEEGGDTELVLVNIRAKAGKKYFASLADGDFRLSNKKNDPRAAVPTSMVETEMRDAGYPPFREVGQGKRGSGWLAFTLEDTTDALRSS